MIDRPPRSVFATAGPSGYRLVMWREYTRETPARRGWALIFSALALAGTTALAWAVAERINNPLSSFREEAPPWWPIRFTLPVGFDRLSIEQSYRLDDAIDGEFGFASYGALRGRRRPSAFFDVQFRVVEPHLATDELLTLLEVPDAAGAEPISIGPLDGMLFIDERAPRVMEALAVAYLPEGLVIRFSLSARRGDSLNLRDFKTICRSVQFTNWYLPRPPTQPPF